MRLQDGDGQPAGRGVQRGADPGDPAADDHDVVPAVRQPREVGRAACRRQLAGRVPGDARIAVHWSTVTRSPYRAGVSQFAPRVRSGAGAAVAAVLVGLWTVGVTVALPCVTWLVDQILQVDRVVPPRPGCGRWPPWFTALLVGVPALLLALVPRRLPFGPVPTQPAGSGPEWRHGPVPPYWPASPIAPWPAPAPQSAPPAPDRGSDPGASTPAAPAPPAAWQPVGPRAGARVAAARAAGRLWTVGAIAIGVLGSLRAVPAQFNIGTCCCSRSWRASVSGAAPHRVGPAAPVHAVPAVRRCRPVRHRGRAGQPRALAVAGRAGWRRGDRARGDGGGRHRLARRGAPSTSGTGPPSTSPAGGWSGSAGWSSECSWSMLGAAHRGRRRAPRRTARAAAARVRRRRAVPSRRRAAARHRRAGRPRRLRAAGVPGAGAARVGDQPGRPGRRRSGALAAAGCALALGLLSGIGYGVGLRAVDRPRVAAATVLVVAAAGLVGYFTVGAPGLHGDRLFVVFKEQADLSGVGSIADVHARRTEVYRRLVATADRTQAPLRRELDPAAPVVHALLPRQRPRGDRRTGAAGVAVQPVRTWTGCCSPRTCARYRSSPPRCTATHRRRTVHSGTSTMIHADEVWATG